MHIYYSISRQAYIVVAQKCSQRTNEVFGCIWASLKCGIAHGSHGLDKGNFWFLLVEYTSFCFYSMHLQNRLGVKDTCYV